MAFRPHLTVGLALSGNQLNVHVYSDMRISEKYKVFQHPFQIFITKKAVTVYTIKKTCQACIHHLKWIKADVSDEHSIRGGVV